MKMPSKFNMKLMCNQLKKFDIRLFLGADVPDCQHVAHMLSRDVEIKFANLFFMT